MNSQSDETDSVIGSPKPARYQFISSRKSSGAVSVESSTNQLSAATTTIQRDDPPKNKSLFNKLMSIKPINQDFSSILKGFSVSEKQNVESNVESATVQSPPPTKELSPEEEHDQFLIERLKQHSRKSLIPSSWLKDISNGFQAAKNSLVQSNKAPGEDDQVDWEFWGKIINDYDNVVAQNPRQFRLNLRKGIPEPIRQLMSNSKSESLEAEYLELLTKSSRHEKIIKRDLARTFPEHEYFKDPEGHGQQSLFNILKAYSLYDKEIGYCQGLPFIVGPLILNMPEEQAFCVLVRLMNDFNFRDLFTPKMIGLQIRNYQFDKLIKEQFPVVFKHMEDQDIKTTMYASQWFMTLFAYRFPLELVFRILDIIFAEGSDAVLRFALALIKHNSNEICKLDFEPLLEYLKQGLFEQYTENAYKLITDASQIHISLRKLSKWETEYIEILRKDSPDFVELTICRQENKRLTGMLKDLEKNYELLNREHINLLNTFIEEKAKNETQCDRNLELQEQVNGFKEIYKGDVKAAEMQVQKEMDDLAEKNIQLASKNASLQDHIQDLEMQLLTCFNQLGQVQKEKDELNKMLGSIMHK